MKFIYLKWRMNVSKDLDIDLNPWGEVIYNASDIARKHGLEIIKFTIEDNCIKAVFCGTKSKVIMFINDFRLGFAKYLRRRFKRNFYNSLNDIFLLREVSEDSSFLLRAIKNEIFIRNINKHLNAVNYLFVG